MIRALVVSEDATLAAVIRSETLLAPDEIAVASDAHGALLQVTRHAPAVVVLDERFRGATGVELCRQLRSRVSPPAPRVLVLTGPNAAARIAALEAGADDCVAKPCSARELGLRVSALLRRGAASTVRSIIIYGPLEIDLDNHRVRALGREVGMSPLEIALLAELARRPGIVRTRRSLLERVWRYAPGVQSRTVDTHVMRLRRKLGPAGVLMETVRGAGYRMRETPPGVGRPQCPHASSPPEAAPVMTVAVRRPSALENCRVTRRDARDDTIHDRRNRD